ncbi:MAG TPA: neuraminidase-like domain-containing protein, partial [Streptosporangiaceae bacterium]|nr:neuraminidase-like domain-containing protein [Streptosporangiaceae bacterium]
GDDPFPLPDANEATDDPLALPEADPSAGDGPHSLWAPRHALLETEVGEEDAREWGWARIAATLREEFGYDPAPGDPSPLTELGEHFFPSVLERHGLTLSPHAREFRTQLHPNDTTAAMWDAEASPFRYDQAAGELYARLPLRDSAVIARLRDLRQLNDAEKTAVQDLYFAPRTLLAQFSMVFGNFGEAVDFLVHAEDDDERFAFFQGEFARFHARCQVVARHLTHHVAAALGHGDNSNRRPSAAAAWRVLRSLLADGNWGSTPWEDDSGQPPGVTLWPAPMGSAFAALLGLAGTGLLGEYRTAGTDPAWRELRGPLTAFGEEQDEHNCPVPTVLPPLGLTLTSQQLRLAAVRNGFAMRDSDGEPLGGAAPFSVRWSGVLLVERPGEYRFHAGAPGEDGPDFDAAQDNRWRVVLQRGQRTWEVLSHGHDEDAPSARSEPLRLRRGAYQVTVEFTQREPVFARAEDVCPVRTGFEVAYTGPDTDDQLTPVPAHRLFRPFTGTTLADGIAGVWPVAEQFLARHYAPDLRDIRRTYQRAFKGLLLAERFRLSADPLARYHQSELGYFLDNPTQFEGTSYYRTGPQQFGTHHAWFALDLLPVTDPCPPPLSPPGPPTDQRGYPSPQRQAALFDWWERLFDYCWLREQTERARERPAWLLFDEAAQDQPDDPAELLRHLDVDLRFAPLVSTYFDTPEYPLSPADLADERWAVRVWHGAVWLRRLVEFFAPASIGTARPDLWASDDPGAAAGAPPVSGNANLTHFVQEGCFGDGRPHRAGEVRDLGNGLRERARDALVAYLCGMDRVLLPWPKGQYATGPADLSGLLLQDVATGICTRMSRVEDAVRAVHAFVQRARLGMEPSFPVTPGFARVWEKRFASLRLWQACRRREVYLENWVEWDDLRVARKVEAFRFLEEQLRRSVLSVAVPGGDSWWPGWRPPQHPTLDLLQDREPAALVPVPTGATAEGLGLLAAQQRAASPAWLAPVLNAAATQTASDQDTGGSAATADLPLWLQTAIGLGTQFVRVAAGSLPPACTHVTPGEPGSARGCCAECEKASPPVVDEYYFWLGDAHYFLDTDAAQDADATAKGSTLPADASSGWEDPGQLPGMLAWNPAPMVHLYWSRLRDGEFTPPRRSSEGLPVTDPPPSGQPQLVPAGRTGDTLRFTVPNGSVPVGYTVPAGPVPYDSADPGFRYDLADDAAVPLPLVAPIAPAPTAPDYFGLPAFPYFAYVSPGAPVEPLSPACVATTVAGPLRAHCQFETALKWYELAYSPMTSDNTWAQCGTREGGGGTTTVGTADGGVVVVGGSTGVTEPGADAGGGVAVVGGSTGTTRTGGTPGGGVAVVGGGTGVTEVGGGDLPCCPSAPVPAPVARDRAVLLAYLETLLHWGDATACRESPEAAQQAKVTFETLARVLGPAPVTVFARDDTGTPMNLTGFKPRPASLNPRLLSLYERCADRLALVSDCLDGRRLRPATPHDDPLFWGDNPLRDGWRDVHGPCDGDPCQAGLCHEDDGLCCCGPYRFSFWVRYAMELTAEVRSLGAELLAAYEKGDAEVLAALRATHERQLADLVLAARQYTWREADWQVQALELTKQGAQARLQYYQQLLAAGLIAGETAYQALTGVAIDDHSSANMSEAIGQVMEYIPDIAFGVAGMGPYLSNQIPIGTKLGGTFQTVARIINTEAEMASTNGGLNLTQASWVRRTAEWQLQVQTITIEIAQIQRQILAAQRHRDAALRDLNVAQRQIEHSAEVQDFLRDKFTNGDLYLYLQQHTAGLYRQTYDLALHAGRRAQRAYNRERGHTARRFLPDPGWDNLHEGLLAGERLQLALRQMETSYTDLNCREYELTKHLSLRLDFPLAYLHLRHRG